MPIKFNFTQQQFVERLRSTLPHRYRTLSDDAVMALALRAHPQLQDQDIEFLRPAPKEPTLGEAIAAPAMEQYYRLPQTAAGIFNVLTNALIDKDDPVRRQLGKLDFKMYVDAKGKADKWVEEDQEIVAFKEWAAENPFEWGKFFTNPAMFGSTLSSVLTSMGTVLAAGAVGKLMGGPYGAAIGAFGAGFVLEGGEAVDAAYERAKEAGMTDEEIQNIMAEAGLLYGTGSGILESIVPLSILRSIGFGRRVAQKAFGRVASNYIDDAVNVPGKLAQHSIRDGLSRYASANTSLMRRIVELGKYSGIHQLTEAGTEASQYMLEEAILDNKFDGTEITLDWLIAKTKDPEFHQSVAGGLLGGGMFSVGAAIGKATGYSGIRTATELHSLKPKMSEEQYETAINQVIDSNDFNVIEKAKFAARIIELDAIPAVEAPPVKEKPTKKKKAKAPVKKKEPVKVKKEVKKPVKPVEKVEPVKEHTRLERFLAPKRGKVTDIPGKVPSEQILNYFLGRAKPGVKEAAQDLTKLTKEDQQKVINMLGQSIVQYGKGLKGLPLKEPKTGEYKRLDVGKALVFLSRKGYMVGEKVTTEDLTGKQAITEFVKQEIAPEEVIDTAEIVGAHKELIQEFMGDVVDIEKELGIKKPVKAPVKAPTKPVKKKAVKKPVVSKPEIVSTFEEVEKATTKKPINIKNVLSDLSKVSKNVQHKKLAKLLSVKMPVIEGYTIERSDRSYINYRKKEIGISVKRKDLTLERSFLHELAHLLTTETIHQVHLGRGTPSQKKIVKNLIDLRNFVREKHKDRIERLEARYKLAEVRGLPIEDRPLYGLMYAESEYGIREFVAEALTNREFQRILDSVQVETKLTAKEKLFNLIKQLLGVSISKDSALGETLYNILNLVNVVEKVEKPVKKTVHSYEGIKTKITKGGKTFEIDVQSQLEISKANLAELEEIIKRAANSQSHDMDIMEYKSEEVEDTREGTNYHTILEERYEGDPSVMIHRYFSNIFGVYLTAKALNNIEEVARKYKNKSFLDDKNFEAYEKDLRKTISEELDFNFVVSDRNKPRYLREIKHFFQKVNSQTMVAREGMDGRVKWELILRGITGNLKKNFRIESINNLVTGNKNPDRVLQSMIEEDEQHGLKTKLVYLPHKSIFRHWQPRNRDDWYTRIASGDLTLDARTINTIDNDFSIMFDPAGDQPLFFFFGDKLGDNSQLLFGAILPDNPIIKYTPIDFVAYLDAEVGDGKTGNMTKEHADEMKADVKARIKANPYAIAQTVAWHEKMKSIKGDRYLMREDSVANTFKRLKLDLSEGVVPRGVGDSSMMVVDWNETEIEVEGKTYDMTSKVTGEYAGDGWLMTSQKYINKINKVMGKTAKAYKTVIRHLDPNKKDYIAVKMMEMIPFEGTKIWKKGKEKELIAEYKNGAWKDANENVFDRLGTIEEVKDRDGIYNDNYKILNLPERATRIIQTHEKSALFGAHPVLGHELALDSEMMESKEGKKYYASIVKYYKQLADEYFNLLYKFRDDVKALHQYVKRDLQEGELPTEIHRILNLFPEGEGLYILHYMRQVLPMVNNQFINNGLYKIRQMVRGKATHLPIKPSWGIDLNEGEIAVSADNQPMLAAAMTEYTGESDIFKLYKADRRAAINELNDWLSKNEMKVLVHRQPIQGYTKVQPRRLIRFVPGHGQAAFLTEHDVFRVHEADFDGDTIFVEIFDNKDVIESMEEFSKSEKFKKDTKIVNLKYFKSGIVKSTSAKRSDRLKLINDNTVVAGAQGVMVNSKTIATNMAFKQLSFSNDKGVQYNIYNPSDKVVMDYWELDYENLTPEDREQIAKDGDAIVKIGDKYHLETTKRHELSILLQAAVDNSKFGLLSKIPRGGRMLMHWVYTRIFYRSDGRPLQRSDMPYLTAMYNVFNYSADRRGRTRRGRVKNIEENLVRSKEVFQRHYDIDNTRVDNVEHTRDIITEQANEGLKKGEIKEVSINDKMTPMEYVISNFNMHHINKFTSVGEVSDNPLLYSTEEYIHAHNYAKQSMAEKHIRYIEELIKNKKEKVLKQLGQASLFAQEMGEDFYDIEETRREEMTQHGIKNPETITPNFDYGEQYSNFISKWYPRFRKLNDVQKFYSTLRFIDGIKGINLAGLAMTRKKIFTLLPDILMSDKALQEYGRLYAESIKENKRVKVKHSVMHSMWNNIEHLAKEGKVCG